MANVAILGASSNPERYSNKAQVQLTKHGHTVFPVSRKEAAILGVNTFASLSDIKEPIDTVTLYINPARLAGEMDKILALKPRRVIFNPGTESPELEKILSINGIHTVEACTLVLLSIGQFEVA
jgi:hypothetical protein